MKPRIILKLGIVNFLLMSGLFLGQMAKDALFWTIVGPRWLPLAFVMNSVLIFIIGGWTADLEKRMSLKRMMVLSWAVALVCTLAFGLLFRQGIAARLGSILYFAFFAFFEVPYLVLITLFWSFAGAYFTVLQADTAFPKITSGAHLGTALAGFLAILGTQYIGVSGLILVWTAMLGLGLLMILWMWETGKPEYLEVEDDAHREKETGKSGIMDGLAAIKRYRYAVLFMLITFCTFFIMVVFNYSLASTSKSFLGDNQEKLTVYLGWIVGIFGVCACIVQLLIIPKLIKILGIEKINLVAPALLTVGSGMLVLRFDFIAASIARGLFLVNEFVFNQTLLPFIYGAVPKGDRAKVRSTIEGSVTNVAFAAAGLFLFLPATLKDFFPGYWVGMAAFLAALAMLALSVRLRSEYIEIRRRKEPVGLMIRLEEFAKVRNREAGLTVLRRDLMSDSESNKLLALKLIQDRSYHEMLDSVLTLANDRSERIRISALEALGAIIQTNEDFEKFANAVRFDDETGKPDRHFHKEDVTTLEAIARVYIMCGRASQLGYDFEYLLEDRNVDTNVRSMAARYIIRESGVLSLIEHATKIFNAALNSDDVSENRLAAEIIGELGYDEKVFQKACDWIERNRRLEVQVPDQDAAAVREDAGLRLAAMKSVLEMGSRSRVAAERALGIAMKYFDDPLLCDVAISGAARIVDSQPQLIDALRFLWEVEDKEFDLCKAFFGNAIKMPFALAQNKGSESESLLLEMLESAEHQLVKQILAALERRIMPAKYLAKTGKESCQRRSREFLERICLCGLIRSLLSSFDLKRADIAYDSLSYRLKDLFGQYTKTIWLACRTDENATSLDRDMVLVHSEDVFARDWAIKSLEITFNSNRSLYIEIHDVAAALNPNINCDKQDRALLQLAKREKYSWLGRGGEIAMKRLFELRRDEWLRWTLTSSDSVETWDSAARISDVEQNLVLALGTLSTAKPFAGVPVELLAELVLKGNHFEKNLGERLMYEGRAGQGLTIVLSGEIDKVIGNQVKNKLPSPVTLGQFFAISGQCLEAGFRVGSTQVRGIQIRQWIFESWLFSHQDAAKVVCRNIIRGIEDTATQEEKLSARKSGTEELSKQMEILAMQLREIASLPKKPQDVVRKRYLVSPIGIACSSSEGCLVSKVLEQYYLIIDDQKELRLRNEDDGVYLITLKDRFKGEVSIEIDKRLYCEMTSLRVGRIIRKKRHRYTKGPYRGWLVDIYDEESPFRGLAIAELEMEPGTAVTAEPPSHFEILCEISDLIDFENKNLALHGLPDLAYVMLDNRSKR